jgi:serine/threonine protein kinase
MSYLESQNIIHRDLKPQNILLKHKTDPPPKDLFPYILKIADFGFAKKIEPEALSATICGSPMFMAPELFQQQSYSSKADLWSLGVILYVILIGKQPVPANSQYELMINLKHHKIHIPKFLSSECKDLLMGLLRKKEDIRMNLAQVQNHPFLKHSVSPKKSLDTPLSKPPLHFPLVQIHCPPKRSKPTSLMNSKYIMPWVFCVKVISYILLKEDVLEVKFCGTIFSMQLLTLIHQNFRTNLQNRTLRLNKRIRNLMGLISECYRELRTYIVNHKDQIVPSVNAPNILDLLFQKIQDTHLLLRTKETTSPDDYIQIKNSLALLDLLSLYVDLDPKIQNELSQFFLAQKKKFKKKASSSILKNC